MRTFRLNSSTVKLSINYNEHLSPAEERAAEETENCRCVRAPLRVLPRKPAGFVCVAATATRTATTTTHPQKSERERRGEPSLRMNDSFLLFVSLNKSLQIIAPIPRMKEEGDGTNSTGRGRTIREELISRP